MNCWRHVPRTVLQVVRLAVVLACPLLRFLRGCGGGGLGGWAASRPPQVSSTVSSLQPSGLTVAMVLLASVLAAVVSQAGLGASPAFRVPEYR